jgi:hypothetical protein
MSWAVVALVGQSACGVASAGFMDCSGKEVVKEETSMVSLNPGPNRELLQIARVWRVGSKHPEFDGTDKTAYMQIDQWNGTGTHSGYWVMMLNSGETLRAKFEGSHYTVTEGGRWETVFQGVFHFISGTGPYEAIRGGGYYRGVEKREGNTEEIGCVASY